MMVWGETGKTAIVGTHVGPEWVVSRSVRERVDAYIDAVPHDQFVYVSRDRYRDGRYRELAGEEWTFSSEEGHLAEEEVAAVLDQYTTIHHLGAYWNACHRRTWHDLVEGIYDRAQEEYTVYFPLNCIAADTGQDAQDMLSWWAEERDDVGGFLGSYLSPWESASVYGAEECGLLEAPIISWDLRPREDARLVFLEEDEVTAPEILAV